MEQEEPKPGDGMKNAIQHIICWYVRKIGREFYCFEGRRRRYVVYMTDWRHQEFERLIPKVGRWNTAINAEDLK